MLQGPRLPWVVVPRAPRLQLWLLMAVALSSIVLVARGKSTEPTFSLSALEAQHADDDIMWQDPRSSKSCRRALVSEASSDLLHRVAGRVATHKQSGNSSDGSGREQGLEDAVFRVAGRDLYQDTGLLTLTREAIVGGEECMPSRFFPCQYHTTRKSAGKMVYVRNLKAASSSTIRWFNDKYYCPVGSNIYQPETGPGKWNLVFAPKRFTVVRHPIPRFVSALGTVYAKLKQRNHNPFEQEKDWFREGGYADTMLDILLRMGQHPPPTKLDSLMRTSLLRILEHLNTQMWFISLQPCDPVTIEGSGENRGPTLSVDNLNIDATLRVEAYPRHIAELQRAPGWQDLLPTNPPPWSNKEQGRSGQERNEEVHLPCRIAHRIYQYYRQDFECLGYTMPSACAQTLDPSADSPYSRGKVKSSNTAGKGGDSSDAGDKSSRSGNLNNSSSNRGGRRGGHRSPQPPSNSLNRFNHGPRPSPDSHPPVAHAKGPRTPASLGGDQTDVLHERIHGANAQAGNPLLHSNMPGGSWVKDEEFDRVSRFKAEGRRRTLGTTSGESEPHATASPGAEVAVCITGEMRTLMDSVTALERKDNDVLRFRAAGSVIENFESTIRDAIGHEHIDIFVDMARGGSGHHYSLNGEPVPQSCPRVTAALKRLDPVHWRIGDYVPKSEGCFPERTPQFLRWDSCLNMIQQEERVRNRRYDFVLQTRPDLVLLHRLPPFREWASKYGSVPNAVYATANGQGEVNDVITICNRHVAGVLLRSVQSVSMCAKARREAGCKEQCRRNEAAVWLQLHNNLQQVTVIADPALGKMCLARDASWLSPER